MAMHMPRQLKPAVAKRVGTEQVALFLESPCSWTESPDTGTSWRSLCPMARGKLGRAIYLAGHRCFGAGVEVGKATPDDVSQQAYGSGNDSDDGLIGCFSKPSSDPRAHRVASCPGQHETLIASRSLAGPGVRTAAIESSL